MSWIKIDNNTVALEASPDPVEVVKLDELQKEILALENIIQTTQNKILEIPEGTNEETINALNLWNEKRQADIDVLKNQKQNLEIKLNEINGVI